LSQLQIGNFVLIFFGSKILRFCSVKKKACSYKFLAEEGTKDLLAEGGQKILPVVPQLIIPIKHALNTKNKETI